MDLIHVYSNKKKSSWCQENAKMNLMVTFHKPAKVIFILGVDVTRGKKRGAHSDVRIHYSLVINQVRQASSQLDQEAAHYKYMLGKAYEMKYIFTFVLSM